MSIPCKNSPPECLHATPIAKVRLNDSQFARDVLARIGEDPRVGLSAPSWQIIPWGGDSRPHVQP